MKPVRHNCYVLPKGLENRAKNPTLKNETPDRILKWRGDPCALVLYGPNGVGKSRLAAAFFSFSLEKGGLRPGRRGGFHYRDFPPPQFWPFRKFLSATQDDFRDGVASTAIRAAKSSFLVLDDFGCGRGQLSDYVVDTLEELLLGRWDDDLPTLITSNWDVNTFFAQVPRLGDRYFTDEALSHEMTGPNFRKETNILEARSAFG